MLYFPISLVSVWLPLFIISNFWLAATLTHLGIGTLSEPIVIIAIWSTDGFAQIPEAGKSASAGIKELLFSSKNLKVETNNSINSTDFLNVDEKSVFEKTSQLLVELFSNYEKIPISFTNLHEPDIRNLTVSTLNTHSNFLSKGEVFNNEGKTDLWIYSKLHLYEYFYEFKIWSNSNDIDEGIKQTCTKYSNHKNKCNGLVVFNKKNKDFSSVIQNIKSIILNNKEIEFEQIKEFNSNSEDDNVFTFTYNHPRASAKKCLLKVLIFNLYSDVKKKKGGSSKLKKWFVKFLKHKKR